MDFGVGEVTTLMGINLDVLYTLPGSTIRPKGVIWVVGSSASGVLAMPPRSPRRPRRLITGRGSGIGRAVAVGVRARGGDLPFSQLAEEARNATAAFLSDAPRGRV